MSSIGMKMQRVFRFLLLACAAGVCCPLLPYSAGDQFVYSVASERVHKSGSGDYRDFQCEGSQIVDVNSTLGQKVSISVFDTIVCRSAAASEPPLDQSFPQVEIRSQRAVDTIDWSRCDERLYSFMAMNPYMQAGLKTSILPWLIDGAEIQAIEVENTAETAVFIPEVGPIFGVFLSRQQVGSAPISFDTVRLVSKNGLMIPVGGRALSIAKSIRPRNFKYVLSLNAMDSVLRLFPNKPFYALSLDGRRARIFGKRDLEQMMFRGVPRLVLGDQNDLYYIFR